MEANVLGKKILVTHPTDEHIFIKDKICTVVGMDLSNDQYIVKTPVVAKNGTQIIARLNRNEFEIEEE